MKEKKSVHVVKLKLKTTKKDDMIIDRRFHAIAHIHNIMVKHAQNCLKQIWRNTEYKQTLENLCAAKKQLADVEKKTSKAQKKIENNNIVNVNIKMSEKWKIIL